MKNIIADSKFPVEGGAAEKFDYLAKPSSTTPFATRVTASDLEISLKLQPGPDGKIYAAGFSVRVD